MIAAEAPLAGLVLAASGVALVPLAGAILRRAVDERPRFFARWGFSHLIAVVLVGLGAATAYGAVLQALDDPGLLGLLAGHVAVFGAVALAAAAIARRTDPEGVRALGFPRATDVRAPRAILASLAAYVCVLPVMAGLERLWPPVQRALEIPGEPSTLPLDVAELQGAALLGALAICVAIGPLLEEIAFRGFLQPLCVQNFSEKGGIAATALAFAALHGGYAFLPLFALALLLGVVRQRTQRLVAAYAVHATHNALVLFVAIRYPELVP